MVLKNNTSSTKAGTTIDECADSDDQVKNEEFKLKKVDLYMERKQKESWEDNGCQNLFRLMNINEPNH